MLKNERQSALLNFLLLQGDAEGFYAGNMPFAFWSSHENLFKFGLAKYICEITICTCSVETFFQFLSAKISRESPE